VEGLHQPGEAGRHRRHSFRRGRRQSQLLLDINCAKQTYSVN
jgi:hypothetical protein